MENYKAGQQVVAMVTAQGMKKGEKFTVIDCITNRTAFGGYPTYTVENDLKELQIINAHFLLAAL